MVKLAILFCIAVLLLAGCNKMEFQETTQSPIAMAGELSFSDDKVIVTPEKIIQYRTDFFTLNTTLYINDKGTDTKISDVYAEDKEGKIKFWANVTGKTTDQKFKYVLTSDYPIVQNGDKYEISKSKPSSCGNLPCLFTEVHKIDLSDICDTKQDYAGIDTSFNPDCKITIDQNTLTVDFYAYYSDQTKSIFIDPTVTVANVSNYASLDNNIVKEQYPLAHANISDKSLKIYMPFDVPFDGNNTYDYSVHNLNGKIYGVLNVSDGMYSRALDFQEAYDGVYISSTLDIAAKKNLTVSAWIKPDLAQAGYRAVVVGATSWRFVMMYQNATTNANCGDANAGISSTTDSTPRDVWTLVTCTWNGTGNAIYINGALSAEGVRNLTGVSTTIGIGKSPAAYGVTTSFNGSIDEVMIWNRTLTADEIAGLYSNSTQRFENNSDMLFRFNLTLESSNNRINITTNSTQKAGAALYGKIDQWKGTYNDSVDDAQEQGLVLYLHFDNRSGYDTPTYAYDFSGRNNHAYLEGNAHVDTLSKFGYGMAFDGIDDKINSSYNSDFNFTFSNLTMAVWFNVANLNAPVGNHIIVGKGGDTLSSREFMIYQTGDDLYFRYDDRNNVESYASETNQLAADTWYHAAVMYNGVNVALYLNGIVVDNISETDGFMDQASGIVIGADSRSASDFNGSIDEVMIFNKSLSSEQIFSLYNESRLKYQEGNWTRIPNGENQVSYYNVSNMSNYFKFALNFSSNGFYSPALYNGMVIDGWTQSGGVPPSTCTYLSGAWGVDCTEGCTITTNTDLGNNDLTFSGSGNVWVDADISNVGHVQIKEGCNVNLMANRKMGK